jgi:hypothetical protein
MNDDGNLLLFMPIIVSSLTNAVYTCRQLNPELNPEQAIYDVILTWERMSSILSSILSKNAAQDLNISQFLSSELQKLKSHLAILSAKPESSEMQQEIKIVDSQVQLLQKILEFLKKS